MAKKEKTKNGGLGLDLSAELRERLKVDADRALRALKRERVDGALGLTVEGSTGAVETVATGLPVNKPTSEPVNKSTKRPVNKSAGKLDKKDYWTPAHPAAEKQNLAPYLYKNNLALFAVDYLSGPKEPPFNGKFLLGDFHVEVADLINKHQRLCILAPRGHGKSVYLTVAYTLWKALQLDGEKTGVIFSASQRQADAFLGIIKREIEKNPKLQHLKPANPKKWAQQSIQLTTGLTINALGYGAKARGGHPDFIVVDDGLNDEDAYSQLVREKNIDYFHSAIENMIMPGGQIVVVGTPFNQEDLYGVLSKNKQFHFKRFQALLDEGRPSERPLWPEVFSLKELRENRESIGEIRFARERMCIPMSSAASLFPDELFVGKEVEDYTTRLGMPRRHWDRAGIKQVFMGVDFSLSANAGADYNTIFTIGVDGLGRRHIMDIFRGHRMSYQQQFSNIVDIARRYNPDIIYVESNQAQRIWGEELRRLTDLPIKLFFTTSEKHSLEKGIPSLRVPLENGRVRIPRGDEQSVELTNQWRYEMQGMTVVEGKVLSTTKNDDMVMSYWIANSAINDTNFSFSFGEQPGDAEAFDEELRKEAELFAEQTYGIVGSGSLSAERKRGQALIDGVEDIGARRAEFLEQEEYDQARDYLPVGQRPPTLNEMGYRRKPIPADGNRSTNSGGYFGRRS